MAATISSLTNAQEQPEQQLPLTQTDGVQVPEEDDYSNDYHRCDDDGGDEENRGSTSNINNNIGPPSVTLETTLAAEQQRQHYAQNSSSSPNWYNQRLVITIPIGQAIPHRPKELLVIPEALWVEFYEKVQAAAAFNYNNNTNTNTTSMEWSRVCCACCTSSLLLRIAIMLIFMAMLVIAFTVKEVEFSMAPFIYLGIIWRCLQAQQSRVEFDQLHGAAIQAVCSHYSPEFEERSNYFVEYKNYKTGLQLRQKIIRQFAQQQQQSNNVVVGSGLMITVV